MTEDELINLLVKKKNIIRETIPEGIFRERAYTTLINPYKKMVCLNYIPNKKEYVYDKCINFNNFIIAAQLDDFISTKLFKYINVFEKKFKGYVGELLAEKMKITNIECNDYSEFEMLHNYLTHQIYNVNCYDLLKVDEMYDDDLRVIPANSNIINNRKRAIRQLVNNIHNQRTNHLLMQHHIKNNKIAPIWILIHTLSLGDILAIFNMFKKDDRIAFCKDVLIKDRVANRQIASVSKRIDFIRKIRNNINHFEPLLPLFINYYDNNRSNQCKIIIKFLKINYDKLYINNIKISRSKIYGNIKLNDYNTKYVEYINDLAKI